MPEYVVVTVNGFPMKKCFNNKKEADEYAQWYAKNCERVGGKAKRDIHVEVKRDEQECKAFDREYDLAKRGHIIPEVY